MKRMITLICFVTPMRFRVGIHIWACESPSTTMTFDDTLSPNTQAVSVRQPFLVFG